MHYLYFEVQKTQLMYFCIRAWNSDQTYNIKKQKVLYSYLINGIILDKVIWFGVDLIPVSKTCSFYTKMAIYCKDIHIIY